MKTTKSSSPRSRFALTSLFACFAIVLFMSFANNSQAQVPIPTFSNIWNIPADGSVSYVTSDTTSTERGIAVNPLTTNVLLVSRTGPSSSPLVKVLNGADGTLLGDMNVTGITGGTHALGYIRVADDGVVYGGNLSVSGSSGFRVYRWDAEDVTGTIAPIRVFGPDATVPATVNVNYRWGDAFDLRGKGTNTQIAVSGPVSGTSSNFNVAILTTVDGTNFTAVEFPLATAGLAAGEAGHGIAFYTNNTLIFKKNTSATAHIVSFDLATTNLTLITNVTLDVYLALGGITGMKFDTNNYMLGVLTPASANTVNHRFYIYDFNNSASAFFVTNFPTPTVANANGVGAADINKELYVGLDTQNGIVAYKVTGYANNVPPSITSQSGGVSVLQGGYTTFTVSASGTLPLKYQWYHNATNALSGKTNTSLTLSNIQTSDVGSYTVIVSNIFGTAPTTDAVLTVRSSVLTMAMSNIWSLPPGSRSYLTTTDTQRGLAYDPVTGHVLLATRSPSASIQVLDAATGGHITNLNMTGVGGQAGETFPINMVGVADDGAVYVCNLSGTLGAGFTIYRWADDSPTTTATIAYSGLPVTDRIGDTFGVRGSGTGTQLIAASRNGTQVVIFTTTDGTTFTENIADVTAAPGGFAGLGLAFGNGNTFWTKSSGHEMRHIAFDLGAVTNGILFSYFPPGVGIVMNIAVDPINEFVAGQTRDTPDDLQLFDIHQNLIDPTNNPVLIDQDFFATDNGNPNGTGAVAIDVNGGRVFALASNNGLIALSLIARLQSAHAFNDNKTVFNWTGPSTLQSASSIAGTYLDVSASKPYTNNAFAPPSGSTAAERYFRLRRN